ncbi:MAG: hypothetical protein RIS90_2983 [Pseudomonadota bacterium]|jgi:phosphoserine phosphatase
MAVMDPDPTSPTPLAALLAAWPVVARSRLETLIKQHAHQGAFAIFDADNTSYQHDLLGALLPFMENKGVLTRATMAPSLAVIPFDDLPGRPETLHRYYQRLCNLDDQISYPWASQIFAGFSLRELKHHLDDLLADSRPIPVQSLVAGELRDALVERPRLLRGQQALYQALMAHGIEVYVVSAASEELVRMVLADPRYGYGVKPENVIGVSLLLKDRQTGQVTTARKQIRDGCYRPEGLLDHELTAALWAPLPWYEGKQAAIHTYVHRWKRPILVAGDTPASDGPMLLRSAHVEQGALRLFVARADHHLETMVTLREEHAAEQLAHGLSVTAHDNWLVVQPHEIG